jgi:stearoyl-CoA desaturase (delta-9 desaturase)
VANLPQAERQALDGLMAQSRVMQTLVEMRAELAAIWARSSDSREQMLARLQDWIARAEASGIRSLQEAALRMRSYRLVAAA